LRKVLEEGLGGRFSSRYRQKVPVGSRVAETARTIDEPALGAGERVD
jgi:hypothetical protein